MIYIVEDQAVSPSNDLKGVGEEPNHEKAWSSINQLHSLVSGLLYQRESTPLKEVKIWGKANHQRKSLKEESGSVCVSAEKSMGETMLGWECCCVCDTV